MAPRRERYRLALSHKLWLGAFVIMAGATTLGAWLIWAGYQDYRRNCNNVSDMAVFNAAMLAVVTLSAERGPANSAMAEEVGTDAELQRRLAQYRERTDASLDTLEAVWGQHAHDRYPPFSARLGTLRRLLARAREAVDAQTAIPLRQRNARDIERAVSRMSAVVNALNPLMTEAGRRIFVKDAGMTDAVMLAGLLATLYEYAGRMGSSFIPALVAQQPLETERQIGINRLQGGIDQIWDSVTVLQDGYDGDEQIRRAYGMVLVRYFGAATRLVERLAQQGKNSGDYDMTGAQFTDEFMPALSTIETLRQRIVALTSDRLYEALRHASWRMWTSGAITVAIIVMLFATLFLTRRRVLLPLMHVRNEIVSMAREGPLMPGGTRPRASTEVQSLFDAMDVLRSVQRRRERLEKERELLSVRLRERAETDALTGVLNRGALEMIGQNLVHYTPHEDALAGLIMVDVDHFKSINDTYGHLAGDQVLRSVAQTIKSSCRESDVVARFGGEEFSILVLDTNLAALEVLAQKIRRACAALRVVLDSGATINLTVSAGAVVGRRGLETWAPLVEHGDAALYRAKRAGRNCVVMESALVQ